MCNIQLLIYKCQPHLHEITIVVRLCETLKTTTNRGVTILLGDSNDKVECAVDKLICRYGLGAEESRTSNRQKVWLSLILGFNYLKGVHKPGPHLYIHNKTLLGIK